MRRVAAALARRAAGPGRARGRRAPKRIVALTPFTANTLAALGVKPVAIGETLGGRERFNKRLKGVRTLPWGTRSGPTWSSWPA